MHLKSKVEKEKKEKHFSWLSQKEIEVPDLDKLKSEMTRHSLDTHRQRSGTASQLGWRGLHARRATQPTLDSSTELRLREARQRELTN